ncbi:MAG: hypothetical protein R3293_19085 [Candidatus Promineifilaceae bacterium]|nr:hypothetical protein [Candidatus Promineifilaceae bacterium]
MGIEAGIEFLARGGLNLFAILDCLDLPEHVIEMMVNSGVSLAEYRRLVLVGHGGRRMWEELQRVGMETADPIDHYSISLTQQFIDNYLDAQPVFWLYPNRPYIIPLQQLGALGGWSYASPLGSGISPVFGVWFAYRAAFLTHAQLPIIIQDPKPSPCASCDDKPCIMTCPAKAVEQERFDIHACVNHRLQANSTCADRCLARMACPYFPNHQYSLEQIQYHYSRSLTGLQVWHDSADS